MRRYLAECRNLCFFVIITSFLIFIWQYTEFSPTPLTYSPKFLLRNQSIPQNFTDVPGMPDTSSSSSGEVVENLLWEILVSENELFSSPEPLSMEYALWSRQPQKVDWSKAKAMCSAIFSGSHLAINGAKSWKISYGHSDQSISNLLSNCSEFRNLIPFAQRPASVDEARFPLAYVLIGARNAAQLVRFFRMIYHPQNAYCITYDDKGGDDFKMAVRRLAKCFSGENVFLSPSPERIDYMQYSVLHSSMTCLKVLFNRSISIPWRYVQITSWNDFPLRTNAEMVEIFKILNGTQDTIIDPPRPNYFVFDYDDHKSIRSIVPDGLTMYKGSFATSMSLEFVEFLFTNPTAIRLFEWLRGAGVAEEHYWPTIIHNLHLKAPGAFPGQCYYYYREQKKYKPFISRYQVWQSDGWYEKNICNGKWVSTSCVYGVADIPNLITRPELIAHKFYEEFQPATLFCMELRFWNRARDPSRSFDRIYYENLPSVRYQKLEDKNSFVC